VHDDGVLTAKRSRRNTMARLLDAAYDVFAERGFQAATIEDVCETAGFTRGAFYSNFTSLDELFLALWDRQAQRIVEELRALLAELADDDNPGERAAALLAEFQPYDRQWFLINTEFLLYALRHPEAAQALAEHRRWLREEMARVFDLLPDIDSRRQPLGIDREEHIRLVIAVFEGGQAQTLIEPEAAADGQLQRAMVRLLIREHPEAI
jgi:AcrR family transcriptional regulator